MDPRGRRGKIRTVKHTVKQAAHRHREYASGLRCHLHRDRSR